MLKRAEEVGWDAYKRVVDGIMRDCLTVLVWLPWL